MDLYTGGGMQSVAVIYVDQEGLGQLGQRGGEGVE